MKNGQKQTLSFHKPHGWTDDGISYYVPSLKGL